MSAMPSISSPTWVTQLKNDGVLLPFGPNGARLIANVVVPACGPCRLARPVSTYDTLPIRMTTTACANDRQKTRTARHPEIRNSTFQTAPAHIQNRLPGVPQRLPGGTCSIPRCSIVVIDGPPDSADAPSAAPVVSLAIAATFLPPVVEL